MLLYLFQVNHLGPTLLTLELLPLLLDTAAASGDGRILFLSSSGHALAPPFDVDKLDKSEAESKRFKDYNTSKLCNVSWECGGGGRRGRREIFCQLLFQVLTGYALQRRLKEKNITVSSINPGAVRINGTEPEKLTNL